MFNTFRLHEILVKYKQDFVLNQWNNEKYKWEAVKCFQDNWDVNADNFADMLARSLSKTYNLLASMNNFPARMIQSFAKTVPEEVRAMYIALFDESRDVVTRIIEFKDQSSILLEKYGNGAGQHYQYENAISTYLWLRYPDKYYIYKYGEIKAVADELGSDYYFKKGAYVENLRNFYRLYDEICEELKNDEELLNLLKSQLTDNCYSDPALKTLTIDVGFYTNRYYSQKNSLAVDYDRDLIEYSNKISEAEDVQPSVYTKVDFLNEVYMAENRYNTLVAVLQNKKNIILQGAPGVGKTFAAKRLAYSIMGVKDDSRIEFVQFHQNYSYEDFMMGYKPVNEGFELKHGIFYRFCQKAAGQPDKDYFFIIDEINRGNMSKIFGELLMLIERDYRGTKATLAYNGLTFSVPENLYIIGMMNTADRSLAMIDYALRRRFSFFEIEPGFDSEGFIEYQKRLNNETFNLLIDKIKELNKEITADKSLGKGFCIGHSYFCGKDICRDEWMYSVVDYDILPMLSEYWFDDAAKLQRWENILHGVFQ
jgi:flagellar biosynthesis GTPase FlhF